MKKSILFFSGLTVFLITGCNSESEKNPSVDSEKAMQSIFGMYECEPDGKSLATIKSIDLRENGRAYTKSEVLGDSNETVGSFEIDEDKLIIINDGRSTLFTLNDNIITLNHSGVKVSCMRPLSEDEKSKLIKKLIGVYTVDLDETSSSDIANFKEEAKIELKNNGMAYANNGSEFFEFKYRLESNQIIFDQEDIKGVFRFDVDGEKLIIKDSTGKVVFKKAG